MGDFWLWKVRSTSREVEGVYAGLYSVISSCNFFLEKIDDVIKAQTDDDRITALEQYSGEELKEAITDNIDKLHFIAEFLLKNEIMDGEQFKAAMEGNVTPEELDAMADEKKRRSEEQNRKQAEKLKEEEEKNRKAAEEFGGNQTDAGVTTCGANVVSVVEEIKKQKSFTAVAGTAHK